MPRNVLSDCVRNVRLFKFFSYTEASVIMHVCIDYILRVIAVKKNLITFNW